MEYGRHFLFPSAIFAEKNPHRITTVLGSCVAVCLYDPLTRQGGINHFMLPFWNGSGLASPRYGNIAIEALIDRMHQMGCQTMTLQAKIFGGANVLYSINPAAGIGKRNIDLAQNMLASAGIRIVASSVGGNQGRKIIFDTYTGEVFHQFLPNNLRT
jgi:chemotaxis protein CheD